MEEQIKTIVKEAVDELNEQLEDDDKLEYSEDIRLIGKNAKIDSMDFVTLITIIEELILDKFDKDIHIVSDSAFSREKSPFYSIGTLSSFVKELIEGVKE